MDWVDARLKLRIIKDPLRIPLDEYLKIVIDQRLSNSRSQSGPMLVWFLLASEPDRLTGLSLG